jgi:hypothetical protein
MAILSSPSGVVEIKLRKLKSAGITPKFFKEWAKPGDFSSQRFPDIHTRYLTPESSSFALSIDLKGGFAYSESFQHINIEVTQLSTTKKLVHKSFS